MKRFFLVLLLVFLAATAITAQDKIEFYTKVGQPMPDFAITEVGGREFKVADLRGKIIYISFWATWCPPCLQEMPRIEKEIWRKNQHSENFVMTAIAREQTERDITPFIEKNDYTFPVAADSNRAIFKLFGNVGIPRSYVVGTDGNILFQSAGYSAADFDKMKKIIEEELKKLDK